MSVGPCGRSRCAGRYDLPTGLIRRARWRDAAGRDETQAGYTPSSQNGAYGLYLVEAPVGNIVGWCGAAAAC